MKSEYFFYMFFVLAIFNKSFAFIVKDYDKALTSYNNQSETVLSSLETLKKHISTIEITFINDEKIIINGYVNGNSFLVLKKFLKIYKFLNTIKRIQYFSNDKPIIIEPDPKLQSTYVPDLIAGSAKSSFILDSFYGLFMNKNTIYDFIFKNKPYISGDILTLKEHFKEKQWGDLGIDYYQDIKGFIDIYLYSHYFIDDLWFIIGKPDGIMENELKTIQLNYINPNILILSSKVGENAQQSILMIVDEVNFTQNDLGAYLVKCIIIKRHKQCKFFGQITEVKTISNEKQVIVVNFITNKRLENLSSKFKNTIVESPDLRTLNKSGNGEALPVPDDSTSSLKTGESISKPITGSTHYESLGEQPNSEHKKQKIDFECDESFDEIEFKFSKNEQSRFDNEKFYLGALTCEQINKIGKHDLNQYAHVVVQQKEECIYLSKIFNKYYIKGLYITELKKIEFNVCIKSNDGDYVTYEHN